MPPDPLYVPPPPSLDDDVFMTPNQLAARWSMDAATLANTRHRGEGLPFVKLPGGSVRYRGCDILAAETRGLVFFSFAKLDAILKTMPGLPSDERAKIMAHVRKGFGHTDP